MAKLSTKAVVCYTLIFVHITYSFGVLVLLQKCQQQARACIVQLRRFMKLNGLDSPK